MRASFIKCVLLSGTLYFIIYSILHAKRSELSADSQPAAGGDDEFPGDDQFDWREISAAPHEEEEETLVEAPCSLRRAVRNDVLLREQFNFTVSVLQWTGSFSKLTWEQLKKQMPPYGWKGLPVPGKLVVIGQHVTRQKQRNNTSEEENDEKDVTRGKQPVHSALSLLNTSGLFHHGSPSRCVRCAVVGNGGILRGSGQGKNIDSHDFVFRMNGAVIKGFEEDVGTKISFYGFTTNTMKNALKLYHRDGFTKIPQSPEIKYIFIPSNLRDYVMVAAAVQGQTVDSGEDEGDRPWKYFGNKPPENFKFLHPAFISYVTNSFLSSRLMTNIRTRHLYMPSTGALMLLTALHTCDQVSAYGFITRNYADFSDHYYDSMKRPLRFFSNHDLRMESRLWELLHHRRVLRLFQRRGAS